LISLFNNEKEKNDAIREIFKNSNNKDLEAFKLFPQYYRHKVFDLLGNKSIEAFKLVPESYRHYCFKSLEYKI